MASSYHTMKAKAWRILEEMPDYAQAKVILNGQKITCFFENIMGENTCTIDGHARNIAYAERIGLTDDKTNIGKKEDGHMDGRKPSSILRGQP